MELEKKAESGVGFKTIEDKPQKGSRGGRYGTTMEKRRNTRMRVGDRGKASAGTHAEAGEIPIIRIKWA